MGWLRTTLARGGRGDPLLAALILVGALAPVAFGLFGPAAGRAPELAAFWSVLTVVHVLFGTLAWRVSKLTDLAAPAGGDRYTRATRRLWRHAAWAGAFLAIGDARQIPQAIVGPLDPTAYMGTRFEVVTLLVAMLLLLVGLLRFPAGSDPRDGRLRQRLDVATVMAGAVTCACLLIQLPPSGPGAARWSISLVTAVLVQPGVFLVAVFAVVKLFLFDRAPFTRTTGLLFGAAAALQAVVQTMPESSYAAPHPSAYIFGGAVLASVLVTIAVRVQERHVPRPARPRERPYSLFPYAAMALTWALGAGVLAAGGLTWRAWLVLAGALVTTGMVVARQVVAFRHIEDLLRERDELAAKLTEQAYHDALTGLANRALFMRSLTESLARGAVTVFLIDLDEFKPVNDSFGHATGDRLLIEVGDRLRSRVRARDTVARLGGDEFAVLVQDLDPARRAEVADGLADALSGTVRLGDAEVTLRASIGMATSRRGVQDPDTVLHEADMAMYASKNTARAARR